jgi:hypothetical protein
MDRHARYASLLFRFSFLIARSGPETGTMERIIDAGRRKRMRARRGEAVLLRTGMGQMAEIIFRIAIVSGETILETS